ncbi:MAG: hypothetical protein E7067_05080 [Lentimicrobiaceae bacterium]|nr:hypothetical protein [Lentimicrobiaceae bacterium]
MSFITKEKKYKWNFVNIGGSARVRINSGEDIAHLAELDPKMWTVLSCPTTGLEIDDKSLKYMDCDGDGKLRINDVISVSQWIMSMLKDKDLILKGSNSIDINDINTDDANGKKLFSSAKQILENLGKEGTVISLSDTADITAIFAKTRFNGDGVITEASTDDADLKATITAAVTTTAGVADRSGAQGVNAELIESFYKNLNDYVAWCDAKVEAPFGDNTDAVINAYNALDAKVKDFFMRSKLAAFSPNSMASLDIQTSRIDAISAENLSTKNDEIAAYPLTHITGKSEIDINAAINPVWDSNFNTIKSLALDASKTVITENDWAEIGGKFAAYQAWRNAKAGAAVEGLGIDAIKNFIAQDKKAELLDLVAQDAALKEESDNIEMVDKFLYIFRDFYKLLKNFVTFNDFYNKDNDVKAIFQCGTLIIDQRACKFCMRVNDTAKHSASAAPSGMYLVYCDCTTKSKPAKLQIVAAMTVGDIGALSVGKNGVFYDNDGLEWDAVITKIIDNPINISQSFWSPYRRMATAIENLINKSAADKDAKMMANATASINAAPAKTADPKAAAVAAPPFDIAKFAGIFAAIGMAVGMIGTALASIFKGLFALKWWQLIILFVGIILVISGPAMVMAWMKLRRRNIAPLLNANGWAINSNAKISIPFGETLTEIAKYPKMKLNDPYAKKGMKPWQSWFLSIFTAILIVVVLWLFNVLSGVSPKLKSPLPRYNKAEVENVVNDTINIQEVVEENIVVEPTN